jgi:hypothetical protein
LEVCQRAGHGSEEIGSCPNIALAQAFDAELGEQVVEMGHVVVGFG